MLDEPIGQALGRHSTSGGGTRLNAAELKGIGLRMHLRPLFAMLIVFGILFAPLAMQGGTAMAMAPADHHTKMTEKGHCGEQPAKNHDGKMMDKPCCAAMCAAIAVAPPSEIGLPAPAPSVEHAALDPFQRSFLAELPTPPPRRA